ncbi:type II toxin-antitoxin system RelE/ParE family toxin [Rosistilla ulvae]|uniref:type II toxin-antitoxin system RelE/ParE family toxin n=1 Tax=Rosistilla ulvae TaxID=1930277 RepID=UPI0011A4AFCD
MPQTDIRLHCRQFPSAALSVVNGIYDKIQLLREHPRMGQRYAPVSDREVCEILYGHYRIPYLIVNDDRIEILGIFHSAMDIDRYLS